MLAAADTFGNPSSIHAAGRRARDVVERARAEVAALAGARPEEIVFTSGGTESDNLAVCGLAEAARAADPARTVVVTSRLEHPAVIASVEALAARGFEVAWVPPDAHGRIALADVEARLGPRVALVTMQLASHELGNVYPIGEIAQRARACGARVHTDAVQAAGKIPVDAHALGVDALSISAHKLGGPKGAGALFLRAGVAIAAHTAGGHQERGRRPGTENVPGLAGFGAAARRAQARLGDAARIATLRDRLEVGCRALGAQVNGDPRARVPNTTNVGFPGAEGELVVAGLDLAGVCASTGAACTSGSLEPSPVVLALGQDRATARTAVRFSLGPDTTEAEIDRVLALLPEIVARVRAASEA